MIDILLTQDKYLVHVLNKIPLYTPFPQHKHTIQKFLFIVLKLGGEKIQ